jgi:hypothetical protein
MTTLGTYKSPEVASCHAHQSYLQGIAAHKEIHSLALTYMGRTIPYTIKNFSYRFNHMCKSCQP